MRRRILFTVSILFYGIMVLLTCTARRIHNSSLVRVTTQVLPAKMFVVCGEESPDKEEKHKYYALKSDWAHSQNYFIVSEEEKYGETRSIARNIHIELGEEADGYYPVVGGDYNGEDLVVDSDGTLYDGLEVYPDDN